MANSKWPMANVKWPMVNGIYQDITMIFPSAIGHSTYYILLKW